MHKNASAKIAVGICSVGRSHGGTRPVRRTFYRLCGHAEIFASIAKPPTRLGAVDAAYGHDKL